MATRHKAPAAGASSPVARGPHYPLRQKWLSLGPRLSAPGGPGQVLEKWKRSGGEDLEEVQTELKTHALEELGDTRWDSYATTTKTAFPPKAGTMPPLTRPKSTRRLGYTYFLNDPIFNQTHYNDEFTWKSYPKDLIQARTSRTLGSHKSHISQDLFHWTLPPGHEVSQKIYLLRKSAASAAGEVRKALANQFVSHTKRDFVDKAEAQKIKQNSQMFPEGKKLLPHPKDTEFRRNYHVPAKIPEFQDFRFNYRCCSSLPIASHGPVPGEPTKKQTTYQNDYGKARLDSLGA